MAPRWSHLGSESELRRSRNSAVRAMLAQLAGMTTPKPGRILDAMQQRSFRGHGAVYRWLRANYEEVRDGLAKTRAPLDAVVDVMVADGVAGRLGDPPNRKSVAKVWKRVCQDVQSERLEQLTGVSQRKRQPSHLPANWQPTLATVSPPSSLARPASPTTQPGDVRKRTPEEKLAAIRAELDARSGR